MIPEYTYDDEAKCGYLTYSDLSVSRTIVLHGHDHEGTGVNVDVHQEPPGSEQTACGVEFLFLDTAEQRDHAEAFVNEEISRAKNNGGTSGDFDALLARILKNFGVVR